MRSTTPSHGVGLPRFAGCQIPDAAPQVNHLIPMLIEAARCAELVSPGEVLEEGVAHRFEPMGDKTLDVRDG